MELPWELYEMFEAFLQVPAYHLAFQVLLFLLASAVWLLFRKSPQASAQKSELTEKEKELIANLTLEPLASPTPPSDYVVNPGIISTEVGEQVVVDGHSFLNLASPNYLGIAELEGAEKAAIRGHRRYAVGSCGPRQFFGVVGVHLELERRLAELMGVEEACLYSFTGVEEACLYSFGFSTIPSVIPSYAKPGDICFAAGITNRFLVVEGIYASRGDICPLPELVNLRRKFQLRLFIDETCSFAVLGHTGRGVREHFNVPSNEIDLMCATLEHGVGAFGGFFCGTRVVVHDQHLSGLGYFSASLPPEQASVSLQAIDYLSSHPELLTRLRQNCVRMHEQLQRIQQLRLGGEAVSPVKHLYIAGDRPKEDCSQLLDEVVRKAWEAGLALTRAPYLEDREHTPKDPSIRISVSASLTEEDIENACDVIRQVTEAVVDA
ncbi:serine palmitoyltransferase 1-like isoform X2 [Haemaphysalis longicornis]